MNTGTDTMQRIERDGAEKGGVLLLGPGEGEDHWQPMPANGHISVRVAPHLVEMEHKFGLGTQTMPPGGFVREHAHAEHDEVLHFITGTGHAIVDGQTYPVRPGTTLFVGRNRRHKFVNDGAGDLHWLWMIAPNGLESFFAAIGRPKTAGSPDPAPFARPADVLAIEQRTGFAPGSEKV